MAAVGFTPISLYLSTTAAAVPLAANLVAGELALNTVDGKLYYKSFAGVVTLLAGATAGPAGGSNTQVQFNSSGALAGSANLTFSGTALAVTGTLSATGKISTTQGGAVTDSIGITPTTGTDRGIIRITNTGGDTIFGMDSSVGGTTIVGASAYDGIVRSASGIAFSANGGSAMQMRLSSTGLAVTGTLSATGNVTTTQSTNGVLYFATANANAGGSADNQLIAGNGTNNAIVSMKGTGFTTSGIFTANNAYFGGTGTSTTNLYSTNGNVNIYPSSTLVGAFSTTGLAVTGTLTLSSATSGTIASFKSTGAYGTVAADNTGTTGGGSFSVKQNGTQYGAFAVDGAIQGNTSSDVAIFADTGSSLKFYTNGSGTVKASLSTAGLFTVAGAASIQGVTVGIGNASASATSTAVGISALASSTGTDATAFGYFAGENLSSGAFSIAIGSRAMGGTTGGPNTGSYNTAIGNSSLAQNTSGNRNIAIGNEALGSNQGGVSNVAVGSYQAAGGDAVLSLNVSGNYNTAVGAAALAKSTVSFNTAVGYSAGYHTSSGGPNTHIGAYAGFYCTTGTNNVSLGYGANGFNIATGFTTGSFNTALGDAALYAISSGGVNVAVGYLAGAALTTGSGGTFLGKSAGSNLVSGDYGTYVGFGSQASSTSASYEMVICTTNTSAVGKGASTGFISAGGTGGIYNSANTTTWATTSDRRLKKNIVGNNTGLDKITSIQVRNFEYRLPEEVDAELKPTDAIQKSGVQLGVIAQELNEVLPECVKTESTGVMSVNADNLTWYMVNAIKELKAEVDSLKAQINGASA